MARSHDTSSVGTHLTSTPRPRTYNWASTRFEAKPGDKCQSHRQRWPQVEAVIQVILRILLICVHICPMYITLLARATFFNWPPITFVSVRCHFPATQEPFPTIEKNSS